jgi:tripartite-type tricarboxylate transporter receptor subunit TctC
MNQSKQMTYWVGATLCCVGILFSMNIAFAQDVYPKSPIKLLVPFAPGGMTDTFARQYAERMSRELGKQMYAENKAGASGARSNPDGYTLFWGTSSQVALLPLMRDNLSYDIDKDFVNIALVGITSHLISVNVNFPAKSLSELVTALKANPGKYSLGHSGVGGPGHLAAELFKKIAGVDF